MRIEKRLFYGFLAVLAAAVLAACWFAASSYRQSTRCAAGRRAFVAQVERLTRDAHAEVTAGRSEADVARFFSANGIAMTLEAAGDHQRATGTLLVPVPKGCARAQCMGHGGQIRMLVELSNDGTVLAPGFVFATGANCM